MKLPAVIILFLGMSALVSAQDRNSPVATLPAYAVSPEFVLRTNGPSANNKVTFVSADDKATQPYFGFTKFRSSALQPGDEILSIDGKAVGTMKPRECLFMMFAAKADAKITLEVRQPNSKVVRKVIAVRVVREGEHVNRAP